MLTTVMESLKKKLLVVTLLLITASFALAEGTKELMPTATDFGFMQIWDQNSASRPFASFDCPVDNRLNIKICNIGEKIYLGFKQTDNDVYFRLKDPNGVVIMGPTLIPSSGTGFINAWSNASAGPSQIVGAAGYDAFVYTSTMTGDYSIEFNPTSPTVKTVTKRVFTYFDATVATAANVIKLGRLWSKAWDFTTNSGTNRFEAKMYVYAKDSIVTSLDFNGMQPFGFVLSCNSKGCTNTGNVVADRQSRVGNSTFPEYKIFLNDPDPLCYPTGTFGSLTSAPSVTGCGSNRCINISVDKAGYIEVTLNINGINGYQPNTSDRILSANVVVGNNCIPWDGRDGLGNLPSTGINIGAAINYFNGLTHLPLFDVEDNRNGYIVNLVRPAGPKPKLFWDDSLVPNAASNAIDGVTNLTGCNAAGGCHAWTGRGDNGCTKVCPETINTWWYADEDTASIPYFYVVVSADANTTNPPLAINDITMCANTSPWQLNGGVGGATGGVWSSLGGGTLPAPTNLTGTYAPTAAEISSGLAKLVITTTGNPGGCPPVTDTLKIHITPPPTVNAGVDKVVCKNNSLVTLNGSFTIATGAIWSGGAGTFSPNATTMNATYNPTAGELSSGAPITLTLTTTGNGLCNAVSDQMTITLSPLPVANAGLDRTVCSNAPSLTLSGSVTNATGGTWTGGTTTSFNPSRNSLTATYTLTPTELAAGTLKLYLTTTGLSANCVAVMDTMVITVAQIPVVNAGADRSVCANNPTLVLSGSVTNAPGGTWTGGTTASFNPGRNSLNATYTLSAAEIATGVTLTLSNTGAAPCALVSDAMGITVTSSPTANANVDQTVCTNNLATTLNGSVTGATGGTWSGGSGTFVPNANTLNATYTPSAGEIGVGLLSLILNSTGNVTCNAAKDTMRIFINIAPTINAGTDLSLCSNKPTISLSGTVNQTPATPVVPRVWTPGGSVSLTPTYNPSAAEISSGSITFTLTANKPSCLPVSDQVVVTFTPSPTINAGPDQTVCKNKPTVSLNGSTTLATGGIWSGGTGTYSAGASSLITNYTPSAAEVTAGTNVKLILTSTGNSNCNAVKDSMLIGFTPSPTVDAGTDQIVCANNASVVLNGTKTIASGGVWSGGLGVFSPNANTLNATYTPSSGEISAGTVTLTLTTTGVGNCNPVSDNMVITITPKPIANAGTDKTVCAASPAVSLSGTVSVTNSGNWSGGSGSFSPGATSLVATYTPSASEILSGNVTLTLTSTNNNNCNPVSDQVNIIITPAPTINAGPDQSICGAAASVVLNGKITGSAGGQWTTNGSGTFSPNASTLNASYVPSASDKTTGSVTLTLTTTGNGVCNAISDNLLITFTVVPAINAGPDMIVCTNKFPIKLAAIGSPSLWTGGNGTFSPNANSLNADYTPSAGEISAGSVTLQITTISSGACPPVTDFITYTIPIGPTANAGPDQNICGNQPTVSLNGTFSNTGGGSSGGVNWISSGSGTFSSALIGNPIYTPSLADKTSGSVTLIMTTAGNGSCVSASDQVMITFTPIITVNAGADQSFCSNNAAVSLSGSVVNATGAIWSGGGSGSFSPNNTSLNALFTPTPAQISSGSITLTLTSQGNGTCPAQVDNVTFTFTPGPTVNAGTDQTVCGDVTSVTLNGSVTVSSGANWTSTGSGSFSPNASTLNASYFPSAADLVAGKVRFALTTSGNGNCSAIIDSMILILTPKPTINAGPDQIVCADISGVTLNGSKTVATGSTWTTAGSGTFTPSNTILNATYVPSAADITNGTVSLTLTTTGAGTCNNVNDLMVISITPAPTVSAGPNQTVCSDVTSVNLNGNITVAGGGSWTSSGSGSFSSVNSAVTTYTPSVADRALPSVTLTLTTTNNGTCLAKTSPAVITFNQKPTVNAGPDQTICADSADILLSETITSAAGRIWTSSGSGAFSPSSVALNPKYIPSAADRSSSLITLTLTTSGTGACAAVSDVMLIHVTPAPTVNAGPDQTICSNINTVNLAATKTIANGILWTSSGSGTFTPNATTLNATYNPSTSDKSAGTVILTVKTTGNGTCNTVSDQMTITITPAPLVNAGPDVTVCGDISSINLNGTGSNATSFTWTSTGSGNYLPSINNLIATYFPTSSELAGGTLTFTLTSSGSGVCPAVTDQLVAIITPKPSANAGADQTLCADATGVSLNGGVTSASGGKWVSSGTGSFAPNANSTVTNYIPSAADKTLGSVQLKLTTTGMGTCNAVSDSLVLTIKPLPSVNAGPNLTVCADADGVPLNGSVTNATGGLWSTNGSGAFSPNNAALNATYSFSSSDSIAGNITLTLTTSGTGTCNPVSDNTTVTITPAPTVNAGPDVTVCIGTTNIPLNGIVTVATGGYWITLGTGTFLPDNNTLTANYVPSAADAALGFVTLALTTSGNGSCNFYSDNITINFGTPTINAGPDQTVCTTNYPVQLKGTGTTGVWSGGGGTFSPNATALNALYTPSPGEELAGVVNLTLTTSNNGVCIPANDQVQISIVPGPTSNAGTPISICANKDSVQLNGGITAPASAGIWTSSGSGTFSPNATALNAYYKPSAADKTAGSVILTLTTAGNGICRAVSSSINLTITPAPKVNAGFDQVLCANAPNATLNGTSIPGGAIWTSSSGTGTFSPGNSTLNATFSPSAADITAGVTLYLSIPGSLTCNQVKDSMTLSYTPPPTVNAGIDTTICADIAFVKLKGAVTISSGGMWTSSGTGTFSPSANTLGASYNFSTADLSSPAVTLTLSSTGNGSCIAVTDTKLITINPRPTVNAGVNQTVCGNNAVANLNGSFTLAPGVTWTSSGNGTFSSSTTIVNPTYTPSATDIAAGAVNLTLTTTPSNGCNAVSDVMTLTITPSPTASVNAGFDKTVCADITGVALNGAVTVAGGGAWTIVGVGSGTFSPDTSNLNASYIPSAADKSAGSVTIRLTTTLNGSCFPVSDDMLLSITPAPTVNASVDQVVCSDTAGVTLNGSVTIASGGTWTSSGSGFFAPNASTLLATYIPSAADISLGSAGLTLHTTGNGTCNAVTDFMLITIHKKPVPNAGADIFICSDATSVPLSGSISFATARNWTTSGTGTFSPSSTSANASYLPSPADIASTKVNLTLTAIDGSGLCRPEKDQVSIFFTPIPQINAGTDQTVCADLSAILVNGTFSIATGGKWTSLGTGNFANPLLASTTYAPSVADTAAGNVSLVFTSTGNGTCQQVMDTIVITITPRPLVNAGSPVSCVYTTGVPLNGTVLIASGGHWSSSGSGSFSLNSNILNASYFPSAADFTSKGVTLTLTSTGNGTCNAVSATTTIDLSPLPIANAGTDQYICRNSTTLISAQSLSNVTYQWSTATGINIANKSVANVTAFADTSFILTVTDTKGCFSRDTVKVFVVDPPVFVLQAMYCFSNFLKLEAHPSNISPLGIFQWFRNGEILTGMNDSTITITQSGTYDITYSLGSCSYSASTLVSDPPVLAAHLKQVACIGNSVTLKSNTTSSPVTFNWTLNGSPVGTPASTSNPINITALADTNYYSVNVLNTNTTCSTKDSFMVIGIPVPHINLHDTTTCAGQVITLVGRPDNINALDNLFPVYQWKYNGVVQSSVNDTLLPAVSGKYIVKATIGGCSNSDTANITLNPIPNPIPNQINFCHENGGIAILDAGNAGSKFKWSIPTADSTQQTIKAGVEGTYHVTITNQYNCVRNDSIHLRNTCPPHVYVPNTFTPDCNVCTDTLDRHFKIWGTNFKNLETYVFNRWGEIIFHSSDRDHSWDGRYNGELMPIGSYVWLITYDGVYEEFAGPYKDKGNITIIR